MSKRLLQIVVAMVACCGSFAYGGMLRFDIIGNYGLVGSGTFAGSAVLDDTAGTFSDVSIAVSDGLFVRQDIPIAVTLGAMTFDTGIDATRAGDDLAAWRFSDTLEGAGLTGDRLFFLDFTVLPPFGYPAAGTTVNAVVTEFLCGTSDCSGFVEETSFLRRGVVFVTTTAVTAVPEPSTLALLGIGLLGLGVLRRQRSA